jgi:hypothetical protein
MTASEHQNQDQYEDVDLTTDQWKQVIEKAENAA